MARTIGRDGPSRRRRGPGGTLNVEKSYLMSDQYPSVGAYLGQALDKPKTTGSHESRRR